MPQTTCFRFADSATQKSTSDAGELICITAVLSMAGVGFDQTRLKVVADPALTLNTHYITMRGKTGNVSIKLESVPAPENPKTSWLACYSALAALKFAKSPVRYGT